MTFLDLFAGIGGFRRGLERSGHVCVGHVEIDKYANKSYMAMYGLETCPYEAGGPDANSCRMCRQEVREDCDGTGCREKCKGEWYAKDIKQLTAGEVPKAEIWTFGFPCTNISISGRMAGLHGERSGLFFAVTGLLKGTAPEDKPRYLIIENVKHLVSNERGGDFTTVLFSTQGKFSRLPLVRTASSKAIDQNIPKLTGGTVWLVVAIKFLCCVASEGPFFY